MLHSSTILSMVLLILVKKINQINKINKINKKTIILLLIYLSICYIKKSLINYIN